MGEVIVLSQATRYAVHVKRCNQCTNSPTVGELCDKGKLLRELKRMEEVTALPKPEIPFESLGW